MQQQQLQMAQLQAQLQVLQAQAQKYGAEAQQTMVETQLMPEKMKIDVIQSAATNLDSDKDFEKRLKLADVMLKEKQINLKAADTASNERIARMQMMNKQVKQ
jgi:hypothetical protein